MQKLPPGKQIPQTAKNVGSSFRNRLEIAKTDLAAGQVARAQAIARRLESSPLIDSTLGQAFKSYLAERLAQGEDPEQFARDFREKARTELEKRRPLVTCLAKIASLFRGGNKEYRVRTEVIQPARSHQLMGAKAWRELDQIAGTTVPLLQFVWSEVGGPYTLGVCGTAKAAAVAGVQQASGICGMLRTWACLFNQYSVSLGASLGGDVGLQVSLARGYPARGVSWGIEVGGAGGFMGHAGISVALAPAWRERPETQVEWLFRPALWEFSGVSMSLGSGIEVDASISLGRTNSFVLGPADETNYTQTQHGIFNANADLIRRRSPR